jgi:hypothetical protein
MPRLAGRRQFHLHHRWHKVEADKLAVKMLERRAGLGPGVLEHGRPGDARSAIEHGQPPVNELPDVAPCDRIDLEDRAVVSRRFDHHLVDAVGGAGAWERQVCQRLSARFHDGITVRNDPRLPGHDAIVRRAEHIRWRLRLVADAERTRARGRATRIEIAGAVRPPGRDDDRSRCERMMVDAGIAGGRVGHETRPGSERSSIA